MALGAANRFHARTPEQHVDHAEVGAALVKGVLVKGMLVKGMLVKRHDVAEFETRFFGRVLATQAIACARGLDPRLGGQAADPTRNGLKHGKAVKGASTRARMDRPAKAARS